jgi:hypothetical protein
MSRKRRHDAPVTAATGNKAQSHVHVLQGEEELRDALRRSAQFEQRFSRAPHTLTRWLTPDSDTETESENEYSP